MTPRNDGCPRCLCRDNEPRSWDEATGKATYRCRSCGHAWATWWEHTAAKEPALLGDLLDGVLTGMADTSNPNRKAPMITDKKATAP